MNSKYFTVLLGLVVSLLVAVPAKADIQITVGSNDLGLKAVKEWRYGYNTGGGGGGGGGYNNGPNTNPSWYYIAAERSKDSVTFSGNTETWKHLGGYALGFSHDYGDALGFLNNGSMQVSSGDTVFSLSGETTGGVFFFNDFEFEDIASDGNWSITFSFDNEDSQAYTFSLLAESAVVPAPATLAVLGLGLAGLGLVRARRKK